MKEELENELRLKYPTLFRDFEYFECQDGWFDIISNMCEEIQKSLVESGQDLNDYKFEQIKQKFGGLRVYINNDFGNKISKIINDAENLSYKTCEVCGVSGKIVNIRGWVFTLCDEHKNKYLNQNTC